MTLRVLALVLLVAASACGGGSTGSPTGSATGDPPGASAAPASPVAPVVQAPDRSPAPVAAAARGSVRDAGGRPVAGVPVTAVPGPGAPPVPDLAVATDAAGRYTWPAVLAPGTYELQAQTPDGPAVGALQVQAGAVAEVDLEVRPR